jgi:hypothetical protein
MKGEITMDYIRYLVQYNPLEDDIKDYTTVNIGGRKELIDKALEKMRQNDPYSDYLVMMIDPNGETLELEDLKKTCRYNLFKRLVPKNSIYASIVRSVVER